MSKQVIRGGHNFQATGARDIVDEVTEDRNIYPIVIKYLRQDGNNVLDGTPSNCDTGTDLAYGVNIANSNNVDYFTSIHLNCGGGHGCEVIYGSEAGRIVAQRICENLAKLGFTNRGAKPDTRGLYEIRRTNMVSNIIEVFFCDSQSDVDLYNRLGIEIIGKAIAEGIVGHSIGGDIVSEPSQPIVTSPTHKESLLEKAKSFIGSRCKEMQEKLIALGYDCGGYGADGDFGQGTLNSLLKFQTDNGLVQDGLCGNASFAKLDELINQKNQSTSQPEQQEDSNIRAIQHLCNVLGVRDENENSLVEDGIIGSHTRYAVSHLPLCGLPYVQREATRYIQARLGIGVDGIFGNQSANAVKQWQSNHGLENDGIVGSQTWLSFLN